MPTPPPRLYPCNFSLIPPPLSRSIFLSPSTRLPSVWSHPDKSSWIPQDTSTLHSPPFVQISQSLHNQGFAFSDWVWAHGMSLCVSVCSYRLWHLHQLKILSESNTIAAYVLICISISYVRDDFKCSLFLKYWGREPYLEADSLPRACCWSYLFSWLPAWQEHFGSLLQ